MREGTFGDLCPTCRVWVPANYARARGWGRGWLRWVATVVIGSLATFGATAAALALLGLLDERPAITVTTTRGAVRCHALHLTGATRGQYLCAYDTKDSGFVYRYLAAQDVTAIVVTR